MIKRIVASVLVTILIGSCLPMSVFGAIDSVDLDVNGEPIPIIKDYKPQSSRFGVANEVHGLDLTKELPETYKNDDELKKEYDNNEKYIKLARWSGGGQDGNDSSYFQLVYSISDKTLQIFSFLDWLGGDNFYKAYEITEDNLDLIRAKDKLGINVTVTSGAFTFKKNYIYNWNSSDADKVIEYIKTLRNTSKVSTKFVTVGINLLGAFQNPNRAAIGYNSNETLLSSTADGLNGILINIRKTENGSFTMRFSSSVATPANFGNQKLGPDFTTKVIKAETGVTLEGSSSDNDFFQAILNHTTYGSLDLSSTAILKEMLLSTVVDAPSTSTETQEAVIKEIQEKVKDFEKLGDNEEEKWRLVITSYWFGAPHQFSEDKDERIGIRTNKYSWAPDYDLTEFQKGKNLTPESKFKLIAWYDFCRDFSNYENSEASKLTQLRLDDVNEQFSTSKVLPGSTNQTYDMSGAKDRTDGVTQAVSLDYVTRMYMDYGSSAGSISEYNATRVAEQFLNIAKYSASMLHSRPYKEMAADAVTVNQSYTPSITFLNSTMFMSRSMDAEKALGKHITMPDAKQLNMAVFNQLPPTLSKMTQLNMDDDFQKAYVNTIGNIYLAKEWLHDSAGFEWKEDYLESQKDATIFGQPYAEWKKETFGAKSDKTIFDENVTHSALQELMDLYNSSDGGAEKVRAQNWVQDSFKDKVQTMVSIYEGLDLLGVPWNWCQEFETLQYYYPVLEILKEKLPEMDYKPSNEGEPLKMFFNIGDNPNLSDDLLKGISLSNSYLPLKTNLYDASSLSTLDEVEWVNRFHYKYGFHRKALYIDTSVDSVMTRYITGGDAGATRVAMLRDLFSPEGDITLFLDPNYYNVKILAEMQGESYYDMQNTEEAEEDGTKSLWNRFADLFKVDIKAITKTGGHVVYDKAITDKITPYGDDNFKPSIANNALLSGDSIDDNLVIDEYSPIMGFAMISGIYRHQETFSAINAKAAERPPVFMSSPNAAATEGANWEAYRTIYNYMYLKNLEKKIGIDYQSQLDMDSPLYMDIYGNILTESGMVVVPAATNATLYDSNKYQPYSLAFLSTYDDYMLPYNYKNSDEFMKECFVATENGKYWQLKSRVVGDISYNFRDFPVSRRDVVISLQEDFLIRAESAFNVANMSYFVTEVIRGAPIENIDKTFEGLEGTTNMSRTGLYMAYKLDELAEMLLPNSNGNSMITLPNLAFMEGVEYAIVFAFKIMFAILIVLLVYQVYVDAVSGSLGLRTMGKFIYILCVFIMCITAIPAFLNISYYEANKMLLQDEMEYITFLNLEKRNNGKEIGIAEITEPKSKTKFYVKLGQVTVPWWEVLSKILSSDTIATMKQVYADAFADEPLSLHPDVLVRSNGLYMDLDTIFDSSEVFFNPTQKMLYQSMTTEEPIASWVLPYYVFLEQLSVNVNRYNLDKNIYSYTTTIQSRGRVRTTGVIDAYLNSNDFMLGDVDILGLYYIYQGTSPLIGSETEWAETEEMAAIQNSLWWSGNRVKEDELNENIDRLNDSARAFVVRNKDLMGKVTDETFLKMMALSMAMEHNNLFKINAARGLEMFDVDAKDVIRLSVASKYKVMEHSAYSFSRFVYMTGGSSTVFVSAILIAVYFVSSMFKPICMLIILASMVIALLVRQFVQRNTTKALEGTIITLSLMMGINVLYALLLKLSLTIPDWGLTPVISVLIQILIQVLYVILLVLFTIWVLKDWKNMGANQYQAGLMRANQLIVNGMRSVGATFSDSAQDAWHSAKDTATLGGDYLEELYRRDAEKEKNRKRGRYDGGSEEDR